MRVLVALLVCLCAAVLVARAAAFTVSVDAEASQRVHDYVQRLTSDENAKVLSRLDDTFVALDSNGDHELSKEELFQHLRDGMISSAELVLLQEFDTDKSGSISAHEFRMGPLHMQELSNNPSLRRRLQRAVAKDAAYADEVGSAQSEEQQDAAFVELQSSIESFMKEAHDPVLLEAAPTAVPTAPQPQQLPISVFGIPSVEDEQCVMCQYFVQRIQGNIFSQLSSANDNAGAATATGNAAAGPFAAGQNAGQSFLSVGATMLTAAGDGPFAGQTALPNAAQAAQQTLNVRRVNAKLQTRPGGSGLVRLVTENTLQALCSVDKLPKIFAPYCSSFQSQFTYNAIRKGLFFNLPYTEVCQAAELCRDDSYLADAGSVHSAKVSAFFNDQRGVCGLLGGPRERVAGRGQVVGQVLCQAHDVTIQ